MEKEITFEDVVRWLYSRGYELDTETRCKLADETTPILMRLDKSLKTPSRTSQYMWGVSKQACSKYRNIKQCSCAHDSKRIRKEVHHVYQISKK